MAKKASLVLLAGFFFVCVSASIKFIKLPFYYELFENLRDAKTLDEFAKAHNLNVTLVFSNNATGEHHSFHYSVPNQPSGEKAVKISSIPEDEMWKILDETRGPDGSTAVLSHETYDTFYGISQIRRLSFPGFHINADATAFEIERVSDRDGIYCMSLDKVNGNAEFEDELTGVDDMTLEQLKYGEDGNVKANISIIRPNKLLRFKIGAASHQSRETLLKTLSLFRTVAEKHVNRLDLAVNLVEALQKAFPNLDWAVHCNADENGSYPNKVQFTEIWDDWTDERYVLQGWMK